MYCFNVTGHVIESVRVKTVAKNQFYMNDLHNKIREGPMQTLSNGRSSSVGVVTSAALYSYGT